MKLIDDETETKRTTKRKDILKIELWSPFYGSLLFLALFKKINDPCNQLEKFSLIL